jgi:DNA excision repair protein ERCC-6
MYQRQIFKQAQANRVLQDPRQRRLFSQKDLHDLLTLQPDNGTARSGGEGLIDTTERIEKARQREEGAAYNLSVAEVSQDDGETLHNILKSKGLVGIFDHNFVDPSGASDSKSSSVREMEEQATRIAKEAAQALRESVDNDVVDDQFTPTWTGSSETESRFGGGSRGIGLGASSTQVFGSAATAGVRGHVAASSGSLLATLRQQNAVVKSGGNQRSSLTGSDSGSSISGTKNNKYTKLLVRIRKYVKKNAPTTDELLVEFSSVGNEDSAIFRRLLHSTAQVEGGRWKLKEESYSI